MTTSMPPETATCRQPCSLFPPSQESKDTLMPSSVSVAHEPAAALLSRPYEVETTVTPPPEPGFVVLATSGAEVCVPLPPVAPELPPEPPDPEPFEPVPEPVVPEVPTARPVAVTELWSAARAMPKSMRAKIRSRYPPGHPRRSR